HGGASRRRMDGERRRAGANAARLGRRLGHHRRPEENRPRPCRSRRGSGVYPAEVGFEQENTMKILTNVDTDPNQPQLPPEQLKKLGEYSMKAIQSGVVVLTGGVVRPTKGIKAQMEDGGKVSFTDGPYAESKEFIDGYAILEAPDLAAAKRITAEFM